jgi:protein phosphatase
VFVNARLHVSGGALGGGRMVEDASSVAVLDTAAGVWCDRKGVVTSPRTGRYSNDASGGDAASELTRRCRHAAAAVDDLVFVYGGLRGGMHGCHTLCLYVALLPILEKALKNPKHICYPVL